jgi:hypothetical protein
MIWGLSLHGWEDVMRGSLAIVGVLGLLVGLSTFFVVTLQREEIAESAKLLDEYKSDAGERIASADAAGKAAQADAAQAVAETARANERTALLEREAAQARAEQERLKATMAWRRITAAQFETLNRILRGHPMKVWVSSLSDDPEHEPSVMISTGR